MGTLNNMIREEVVKTLIKEEIEEVVKDFDAKKIEDELEKIRADIQKNNAFDKETRNGLNGLMRYKVIDLSTLVHLTGISRNQLMLYFIHNQQYNSDQKFVQLQQGQVYFLKNPEWYNES